MYFNNDKENTNIDNQFKEEVVHEENNSGKIVSIILGSVFVIAIIVAILIFAKRNSYSLDLYGNDTVVIYQGTSFTEPGYYAHDRKNNNLTDEVVVDYSNINSFVKGSYTITYTFKNITKYRYVTVTDKMIGSTVIQLVGDDIIKLKVHQDYVEPGYIATDSVDGNITKNVIVESNVNTSRVGTYTVTYKVTNSTKVVTKKTRTIIVSE